VRWADEVSVKGQPHINGGRKPAIVVTSVGVLGKEFTLVKLVGDVGLELGPDLTERVTNEIERGAMRLVFDLSDATFIDSATLGTMVGAHQRLSERGGRLGVVCHDPMMLKVLAITGLDRTFPVHEDLASLLAVLE
jgi:anti-sigma B factor antagonist